MKIAIVPDIHLNKTVYKGVMDKVLSMLPFRNVDFMKAFEYVITKCIDDIKPDLVVIPGDIYDNFEPSNEIRGFLSSQLSRLSEAKIPIILLIGNHDVCKKHHGLKDIQELKLKNIVVVDKPDAKVFRGTRLFFFPYSLEVEQQKKTIKEDFQDFVRTIKSHDDNLPSIFFGHFGVKGAVLNQYTEEEIEDVTETTDTTTTPLPKKVLVAKDFNNRNANDIGCDDLDGIGADYVILGDYHKHQILNTKKCIAMYPGSLEKTSFTEVDQQKGFVVYDSEAVPEGKLGKCKFIEYPNCRPMIELRGNMLEIKKAFQELDYSKYQGAIVKLRFTGTHDELISFSANLEFFKKEIREKINPIHVYYINKADNKQMTEEATKLEKEIMEKGHLSNDDVVEVAKEMLKEQIKDDKEKKLTIDLADEIYKETVGA